MLVDEDEIAGWARDHPQPYQRDAYQDPTGTVDEPYVKFIRKLANDGLAKVGHHGPSDAMGVPRDGVPTWDDLQFVVGQLHKLPLLDDEAVGTELLIGPKARKPTAPARRPAWTVLLLANGETRYGLRKQSVEPVFGIIKSVMRFRQFLLCGLDAVRGEWSLVTLAWNIRRMAVLRA